MTAEKKPQVKRRFWTPLRVALTVVVLSLVSMAGISSCTSSDEKENRPVATQPNANAPGPPARVDRTTSRSSETPALPANVRSARLRSANGGTISLADFSGKVVLINLWATWCGPCRVETPELVRLHKEFQSRGVEMVGLSTEDPDDSADSVKNFVRTFQVDYHIGWAGSDVAVTLMELTGRDAIPQSFIISRDGRILRRFVGFNPVTTPPQIKLAIEDALKGV